MRPASALGGRPKATGEDAAFDLLRRQRKEFLAVRKQNTTMQRPTSSIAKRQTEEPRPSEGRSEMSPTKQHVGDFLALGSNVAASVPATSMPALTLKPLAASPDPKSAEKENKVLEVDPVEQVNHSDLIKQDVIVNRSSFMKKAKTEAKQRNSTLGEGEGTLTINTAATLQKKAAETSSSRANIASTTNSSWSQALGFNTRSNEGQLKADPLHVTVGAMVESKKKDATRQRLTDYPQFVRAAAAVAAGAYASDLPNLSFFSAADDGNAANIAAAMCPQEIAKVQLEEERYELKDNLLIYSEALGLISEKLQANLGPVLAPIAEDLVSTHRHLCSMLSAAKEFAERRNVFETEYKKKTNDLRINLMREMKNLAATAENKETASEQLSQLAQTLEEKVVKAKEVELEQEKKISDQGVLIKELTREMTIKRLMLKEIQSKTNQVIMENRYLRNICAHNADLLREVETRKEAAALAQAEFEAQQNKMNSEVLHLKNQISDRDAHLRALKGNIAAQQEEVELLHQCHSEAEALLAQTRVERDTYQVTFTPRPSMVGEATKFLRAQPLDHLSRWEDLTRPNRNGNQGSSSDVAGTQPSKSGKVASEGVLSSLLSQAQEQERDLKLITARMSLQTNLVDYLADDELDALSKVPFSQPHSSCVQGLGNYSFVPQHLRWNGPLVVRSIPIEELVPMLEYMREDRFRNATKHHPVVQQHAAPTPFKPSAGAVTAQNNNYHRPVSLAVATAAAAYHGPSLHESIAGYCSSRFGAGLASVEAGMSLEHSLKIHQWCPIVETFLAVLQGRLPLQVFDECVSFVRVLFVELRALLPAKSTLLPAERKKKRYAKKKAMYETISRIAPWITEPDLLRLKAVLHSFAVHKLGDATVKALKDDFPLEMSLDPPELDEDTALLFNVQDGASLLSPMAMALVRLFVFDYRTIQAEVLHRLVTAASGGTEGGEHSPRFVGAGGSNLLPRPSVFQHRQGALSRGSVVSIATTDDGSKSVSRRESVAAPPVLGPAGAMTTANPVQGPTVQGSEVLLEASQLTYVLEAIAVQGTAHGYASCPYDFTLGQAVSNQLMALGGHVPAPPTELPTASCSLQSPRLGKTKLGRKMSSSGPLAASSELTAVFASSTQMKVQPPSLTVQSPSLTEFRGPEAEEADTPVPTAIRIDQVAQLLDREVYFGRIMTPLPAEGSPSFGTAGKTRSGTITTALAAGGGAKAEGGKSGKETTASSADQQAVMQPILEEGKLVDASKRSLLMMRSRRGDAESGGGKEGGPSVSRKR